jgi:short-subunit dehydrogenase
MSLTQASPIDNGNVLITGASSGIGREIARQLAPRARTLVLIARRRERLEALRAELLEVRPELRVEVVACDLADIAATTAAVDDVVARVGTIDVFVNNAGSSTHGLFESVAWEKMDQLVRTNVTTPLWITRRLVPEMVARRHGGLLVIGSGAGVAPMLGEAAYSGSKHFIHGLTETLRLELRSTAVRVTEVCPGPVTTEFDASAGIDGAGSWGGGLRITADQCAREAIAGFDRGRALVYPGRTYRWLMYLRAVLPTWVQRALMTSAAKTFRLQHAGPRV